MKTFEQQQSDLIFDFKKQMMMVCEEIISGFYTDVTPYAEVDAHINFTNKLRDEVYNELVLEISSEHTMYSWASTIRMALLEKHKDQLQNKIIQDLQEIIERKNNEIEILHKRYL